MKISIQIILLLAIISNLFSQSPYKLNTEREIAIFGFGAITGATALFLDKDVNPITKNEIAMLSVENINSFDRLWMGDFSQNTSNWSDGLLITTAALPGLILFDSNINSDIIDISTMYLQTMLIAGTVPYLTKAIVQRYRPFIYQPNVDFEIKNDADGRRSFFSGHSATSFASAVFFAKVYSDYYPNSKYLPIVWGTSLILASTVAILRVEAGKHFLSDIITGAIFGSVVGYVIPELHQIKDKSYSLDISPIRIAISYRY